MPWSGTWTASTARGGDAMTEGASAEPASGDAGTLRHERFLAHSPERVWEAITSPADMEQWMMARRVTVEGRVGGRVEVDALLRADGRILVWDPPRKFEHDFRVRTPGRPDDEAVLSWELRPEGSGTRLTMTFRRLAPELVRVFARGQPIFVDRLEALLGGKAMPDLRAHAAEARRLGGI